MVFVSLMVYVPATMMLIVLLLILILVAVFNVKTDMLLLHQVNANSIKLSTMAVLPEIIPVLDVR